MILEVNQSKEPCFNMSVLMIIKHVTKMAQTHTYLITLQFLTRLRNTLIYS